MVSDKIIPEIYIFLCSLSRMGLRFMIVNREDLMNNQDNCNIINTIVKNINILDLMEKYNILYTNIYTPFSISTRSS